MSNHQFGQMLYRTHADMLAAIAYDWASSGSTDAVARESLAACDDAKLARDCIEAWELGQDEPGEGETDYETGERADKPSHMVQHGYTADDLAGAFADLRVRLAAAGDESWYAFKSYNAPTRYGFGTQGDAETYCEFINATGHGFNTWGLFPLTEAEAAELGLDERTDAVNLNDELAASVGQR